MTKDLMKRVTQACDASMSRKRSMNQRPAAYRWIGQISVLRKECLKKRRITQRGSLGEERTRILASPAREGASCPFIITRRGGRRGGGPRARCAARVTSRVSSRSKREFGASASHVVPCRTTGAQTRFSLTAGRRSSAARAAGDARRLTLIP
ncbi:hypothetical protein EVAR_54848_1 [Eumeta japonica]|uniref:Uncharacterized protein n=1 Tax=Eumeta variegata TaxID=151549 RepID=A0A4C1YCI2_EUMVA|nr:hypothetical protein EVAR_54848_1 [Eumeta japonica]